MASNRWQTLNQTVGWIIAVVVGMVAACPPNVTCAQQPVDFAHQIAPLIRKHCATCHTSGRNEGSLSLDTRDDLMRSDVIDLNDPGESELLARLVSDDPESRMPLDQVPLSPAEIELFRRWIAEGLEWDAGIAFSKQIVTRPLELRPLASGLDASTESIDRVLDRSGKQQFQLVDDRAFIRRVSLDLVGLLPSSDSVELFAADTTPDKRTRLVENLLVNDRDYAEHWLTFWNDLLRNDYNGTGYIDGGRAPITDWLYRSLLTNKPYDVMVGELIVPSPGSDGFSRGIRWRGRINASQVVELQFAQNVGQVFLGLNLKCASCHDSFIDSWKLTDAYGLAAVIADAPLEIHRCDVAQGSFASPAFLFPELGAIDPSASREQRLAQLAVLLTKPENGRFSRTIVNRLWQRLMGRGLVEPMDSMDAPAWNEELLDWLATDFVAHQYDLKHILRAIATSRTYQTECVPLPQPGEPFEFRGPIARRFTAEQWLDAIWQITGRWPEQPAVDFGYRDDRPVRASLVNADRLMRVLGRPNREQVVTTRPAGLTTLEAMDLINGAQLMSTLEQGSEAILSKFPQATPDEIVIWLYRSSLSRDPSEPELKTARQMLGDPIQKEALTDLLWITVLLPEFCFVR